ncbi:MAG: polysaccharide deacetylase family protein [Saprospiraceae bacterium]|jgi:peptidoglycan/xylan/chitin deacetylase (PgdA/CDA1 family)|nr:polysaccharide deacetylase family protein [Saprospiraceae bacterium]
MSLRNTVFKLLRYSGLPWLIRETLQRRRVTIAMFHDIEAEHAEQVFGYLAKKFNVISLDDYLAARQSGDASRLPDKALIITLDDGHIRNRTLLPVLEKLNLPATIFLCAGIVDTRRHYWFKYKHPEIDTQALKLVPNHVRLETLARVGFTPEREFDSPQAMSKAQIQEMASRVNFQSHTTFHPCLHTCTEAEAREEVFGSKKILEQDFGLRINALAYPNGDYCERDIELIKQAGYDCAIAVDFGYNTLKTPAYRLKRLSVDDTDNVDAVCVKVSGLWTVLMWLAGKRRLKPHPQPLPRGGGGLHSASNGVSQVGMPPDLNDVSAPLPIAQVSRDQAPLPTGGGVGGGVVALGQPSNPKPFNQ